MLFWWTGGTQQYTVMTNDPLWISIANSHFPQRANQSRDCIGFEHTGDNWGNHPRNPMKRTGSGNNHVAKMPAFHDFGWNLPELMILQSLFSKFNPSTYFDPVTAKTHHFEIPQDQVYPQTIFWQFLFNSLLDPFCRGQLNFIPRRPAAGGGKPAAWAALVAASTQPSQKAFCIIMLLSHKSGARPVRFFRTLQQVWITC